MAFIFLVIAAIIVVILVKYGYDLICFWRFFSKIPGVEPYHPIFGNLHLLPGPNEKGLEYEMSLMRKFQKCYRIWAGPFVPVIVCYHPDVVKTLLKSTAPKPRGTILRTPYDMGLEWIGEGLLLSNGNKWSRNRRLLTPAFHFDILKNYLIVFNECAQLFLNKLDSKQGESFDVFPPTTLCTLDVILRTAFSHHSDCQTSSEQTAYVKNLKELVALWTVRSYDPLIHNEFIYKLTKQGKRFYELSHAVHTFAEDIISKRRKALGKELEMYPDYAPKVRDFLDTLILAKDENGNGLTPLEIRDEVDTFMFEGNDTTASAVSWTLYSLASDQIVQAKVYEEVISVLGEKKEMEWGDLTKLEYTTMCIKEAMRCHGVVPLIERRLNEPLEMDGHVIPEGTLVAIHLWDLHHNPHVWDRPHDYDPERFNQENQVKMDPFQFLPFSAGTRNCIGQTFALNEMRVIVSSVIRKFHLKADETEMPRKFIGVTMRTEDGAKIFATRRK